MLKNYLKIAWRNLIRSKGYSALNILGFATGMAVTLVIGLWVHNEYSYDKFLPNYRQLYRVQQNASINGEIQTFNIASLALANALRTEVPEIKAVAESDFMGRHGLMVGNTKFYMNGAQVAEQFLSMFQYPLLKGNAQTVFKDAYSIILTESTAQALFGDADPMEKIVRFDNKDDLKVTGILKDLPGNSSLQFNFLVPFSYLEQTQGWVRENRTGGFGANAFQLFVQLKDGISYQQVEPKIKNIIKKHDATNTGEVMLHPLQSWHLYSEYENGKVVGGFIEYVRIFSIIGILVLLIACINFVNLTTARSERRAREVGVRKAIGSERKDLIFQFLTESFLFTLIAFMFSLLLVQLALPAFNLLTGNEINIPFLNLTFWVVTLCSVIVTGLLAGSRPAFYLSSFNAVKVLKGAIQTGKGAILPRKILLVLQFSCSIALIICTIIIYRQIQYAKERPAGYDMNRLMITDINNDLSRNFTAFKNNLVQQGIVESVTTATSPATSIYWHSGIDGWPGKKPGETINIATLIVSDGYFKTLRGRITTGRDFFNEADSGSVILNEAAVKQMRLKEPLNQIITWQENKRFRIVGVTKDALMSSPFEPAEPSIYMYSKHPQSFLMYRLAPGVGTRDALAKLKTIFNQYSPAYPYDYRFADEEYAKKFNTEVLISKLAGIFAGLAIFISCLGLFGLAAYLAEQRTKEMGIRKVLGASVSQLWLLLSKDFIVLVLVSCLIASPVALYVLQNWLAKYPYRVDIGISVFVVSSLMAMVITIVTISFQAIKAAVANPVKSLRTE